jgi:DNA-binding cell septation regulator SpoVG
VEVAVDLEVVVDSVAVVVAVDLVVVEAEGTIMKVRPDRDLNYFLISIPCNLRHRNNIKTIILIKFQRVDHDQIQK